MKKMRTHWHPCWLLPALRQQPVRQNFTNCADRLKDVGLFQGTNQGYPA